MTVTIIEQKLVAALDPINIEVIDESYQHVGHSGAREGGQTHFFVKITADKFNNMPKIQRHKLIYKILDAELKQSVHALKISAFAPGEVPV